MSVTRDSPHAPRDFPCPSTGLDKDHQIDSCGVRTFLPGEQYYHRGFSDSPQVDRFLEEFRQFAVEQSTHEARKQAVTRRMNEILEEERRTASALKVGLKHHLGNRNEELVKFGIQPLRARKRHKSVELAPEGEGPPSSGEPSA
jgi:hypothetical protein